VPRQTTTPQASINASFRFLNEQMDHLHRSLVIVALRPEDSAFYPASMPEREKGDPRFHVRIEPVRAGGLKLTFPRGTGQADDWAGVMFLNARDNWGQAEGTDLTGATTVRWRASAAKGQAADVSSFAGGVNWDGRYKYPDSLEKTASDYEFSTHLTDHFGEGRVDLSGGTLDKVIGVFGVAMPLEQAETSIYIHNVTVDKSRLNEPRFIASYVLPTPGVGGGCELTAPNAAFVYDQALALIAYLARPNNADDRMRATLLADALVIAQKSDRLYHDGRLRNGYASGTLLDPGTGYTRLPGRWDGKRYLEDEYSAGTDTFVMGWAGLALLRANAILQHAKYLEAATNIGKWIIREMKAPVGFCAGKAGLDDDLRNPLPPVTVKETRTLDNINLVALFHHLEKATGDPSWDKEADHATTFVEKMWSKTGHFASGAPRNSVLALAVQTSYAMMSNGGPHSEEAIQWAVAACRGGEADTFDFDCGDHDGSWWEGSAQVVAAYRALNSFQSATDLLARLRRAQQESGAIPAASKCRLTTHFWRYIRSTGKDEPWLIPSNQHVGSTSWHLLAELGINPYQYFGE
jgi:hypothetical protein